MVPEPPVAVHAILPLHAAKQVTSAGVVVNVIGNGSLKQIVSDNTVHSGATELDISA